MKIIVKNKLIKEDIFDEEGKKIGELVFNPNDNRIMNKLYKIVQDAQLALKKLDKLGKMPDVEKLKNTTLTSIEDFEKVSDDIDLLCKGGQIETDTIEGIFQDLYEVFGKDTINAVTQGTQDLEMIEPIMEFVKPYIEQSRKEKMQKYLKKSDTEVDVLE